MGKGLRSRLSAGVVRLQVGEVVARLEKYAELAVRALHTAFGCQLRL